MAGNNKASFPCFTIKKPFVHINPVVLDFSGSTVAVLKKKEGLQQYNVYVCKWLVASLSKKPVGSWAHLLAKAEVVEPFLDRGNELLV